MAKRRKKRHIGRIIALTVLVAAAAALFFGRHAIVDGVKVMAAKSVAKKLIEEQLKNSSMFENVDVSKVIDSMDENDIQAITDIAGKYLDLENLGQYVDMAKDGNFSGIKEQVKGQLTEEDKQQLQGLYEKYKDQIPVEGFSTEDLPLN